MFNRASFFATIRDEEGQHQIKRLKLDQKAQVRLISMFTECTKKILTLEVVAFDGSYKTDEGEIHKISNFQLPDIFQSALKEPSSIEELKFDSVEPPKINSVFTGTPDSKTIVFQKFSNAQYITNKGVSLFHNSDTFQLLGGFGINILDKIDCIFSGGNLLFQSFFTARQVFDLSSHYREATDTDVNDFIHNKSISIDNKEQFFQDADSWVRRKVALIKDSGALDKYTPTQIREKAASYGLAISVKSDKQGESIILPHDKKALKDTLRFLDEEIYKGALSNTTYLTNSKRKYG